MIDISTGSSTSYQSASENSSSPDIELGCKRGFCKNKIINVLTKQQEEEQLLIELIAKIYRRP